MWQTLYIDAGTAGRPNLRRARIRERRRGKLRRAIYRYLSYRGAGGKPEEIYLGKVGRVL
jgi:hypothetical protein